MSIESGKFRNVVAGLALVGAAVGAWDALVDKTEKNRDNTGVVEQQVDGEPVGKINRNVESVRLSVNRQLDDAPHLVIPLKLPKLRGVDYSIPREISDADKKFLADIDEYLHRPADVVDCEKLDDAQLKSLVIEEDFFNLKSLETASLAKNCPSFWDKDRLERAFPNFVLMGGARLDDLPSYFFVKRPGLVSSPLDKYVGLSDWQLIPNPNGLLVLNSPLGSTGSFVDSNGELVKQFEMVVKARALQMKKAEEAMYSD